MITTKQVRDEDRHSGNPEDYVPIWGFADERVFLTAAGETGMVLQIQGTEY
jgi:hypothetical protein